jgi:hypothetical protein
MAKGEGRGLAGDRTRDLAQLLSSFFLFDRKRRGKRCFRVSPKRESYH